MPSSLFLLGFSFLQSISSKRRERPVHKALSTVNRRSLAHVLFLSPFLPYKLDQMRPTLNGHKQTSNCCFRQFAHGGRINIRCSPFRIITCSDGQGLFLRVLCFYYMFVFSIPPSDFLIGFCLEFAARYSHIIAFNVPTYNCRLK